MFLSVRKPHKIDNAVNQMELLTDGIFKKIYSAYKLIHKQLLTLDGTVHNLEFPGHKWSFRKGGNYFRNIF